MRPVRRADPREAPSPGRRAQPAAALRLPRLLDAVRPRRRGWGHYRVVPRPRLRIEDFALDGLLSEPRRATESLLQLDAWRELEAGAEGRRLRLQTLRRGGRSS